MPIFEYQCSQCGEEFEHLVLHSSLPPCCPSCQGEDLEKLISLARSSSEQTRKRSLRGAKERARRIHHEREHEDHKKLHKHLEHKD